MDKLLLYILGQNKKEWLDASIGWGLPVAIGFVAMFLQVYAKLFSYASLRPGDNYSWLVALIALYLFFQNRVLFLQPRPEKRSHLETFLSVSIYGIGLLLYVIGTSQAILSLSLSSQVLILLGLIIYFKGYGLAKKCWFALFFLIFIIPFPAYILDPITLPMKIMVSMATEWLLHHTGYLVARDGVILQVDRYQLFVADACAGMKTLLSLEAMGLLYLHVVQHDSWRRNLLLGILIVPISLFANILRVTILALITYHLGEAAGRGFMHFYAGILLFLIALSLIMMIDHFIQKRLSQKKVANKHG